MNTTSGPTFGSTPPLRLALAEDSAILRDGLVSLLERRGHEPVAVAADGETLLAQLAALPPERQPDVAVLDVRMPPSFTDEGLRCALTLRQRYPGLGVLLFSQHVETRFATELFRGNPRGTGYLLKDRVADVREFLDALTRIAAGATVLDPEVVTQLLGAAGRDPGLSRITAREEQVLKLMAQGRSNGAIAEQLVLSAGAVEKYIGQIFAKLDLAPASADHRRVLAVLRYLGLSQEP